MNVLAMLLARRKGIPICQFVELYNAYCGRQALPRYFDGNASAVKKLLYTHKDIVEVRKCYGKLYVFIRDPVPPDFQEIREIVLKDKKNVSKVNGVGFTGPEKEESVPINMEELVSAN
ncbi:unnamed protein product [Orchesella dallaii]|uniref:Uncharacterized protein n=1 Tax=Orchesella dallaii TaxID=48710 RepID=A0ABP1PLG3_9HEXA